MVLWELLTGERFLGTGETSMLGRVVSMAPEPPSAVAAGAEALDASTLRALAKSRDQRFSTALEMAEALETALTLASRDEVAAWVRQLAGESLVSKERLRRRVEETVLEATVTETAGGRAGGRPGTLATAIRGQGVASAEEGSLGAAEHGVTAGRARRPAVALLVAVVGVGVAVAAGARLRGGETSAPGATVPGAPVAGSMTGALLTVASTSAAPQPLASAPPPVTATTSPRPTLPVTTGAARAPASARIASPSPSVAPPPAQPHPLVDSNGLMVDPR